MNNTNTSSPSFCEKKQLSIEKTVVKSSKSNSKWVESPKAYFDENNRKVMIVQNDHVEGN